MPGVRSITGRPAASTACIKLHPQPQPDVEAHRSVFDEQVLVPLPAIGDGHGGAGQCTDQRRAEPGDRRARDRVGGARGGAEPHPVAGLQLAELPAVGGADHTRADKPPRLGPSGPRMIGMSPVKSIAPMA